ncbi:AAA family ATPase [Pseudoalteromonas sp. B5MOD-1]|uniref:AAA family ATPase n=1 Tax=Pseudoalteromonas sp. P80D2 TaxID=3113903 RepID=UPI002FC7B23B
MIINQISMKNFQCYVGGHERNNFKFQEGLNLIVGNNGGGKSKLFDAFYWVLYDKIFNSDTRAFTPTREYGEKLVSDKVTRNLVVGETASAEVVITAIGSNEKEYRLTRAFHVTKMSEDNKWVCEPSRLIIEDKKTTRWFPCSESEESVLRRVIPPQLKPYMWFQGEQVDGLMDLTDKSALTQIINILSDISKYDGIVNLTEKGGQKASADLRKAQNKLSKDANKSEELSADYDKQVVEIANTKNDIEIYKENLEVARVRVEELISKIDDATKKSALKERKASLETECEHFERSLTQKHASFNSKLFKDFWILKNAGKHIDKFAAKYKAYHAAHQERINQNAATKVKLPMNVPGPVHVQQMLEDCKCYVCDREAPKDSEAWEHIKSLIERNSEPEKELFVTDCSQYFQELYESSLRLQFPIKQTDQKIAEEFASLDSLRNKINESKSEIDKIKNDFESLLEDDRSEFIVNEFRQHEKNKELFSSRLAKSQSELKLQEQKLSQIQNDLDSLVTGNLDNAIKNADKIFGQLRDIAKSTRKDVYASIVNELESTANSIFENMASRNNSIKGKIKLKMMPNDTCIPEIVDNDGYNMSGSNDSNIILVKLSLIIAILTSKAKWSENYSLISDAPTAKMAKGYSDGFYEALSQNFKQSIVMTYDFIEAKERENLLRNQAFKIGSLHLIESHFPNGNRDDRSDLEVLIKEVSK